MARPKLGNVFYIGMLSFFGGISQDIFVPILPLYLANVLGMDKALIGISEGLVTAGASLFKIAAGFLIDRTGAKKPFIFAGYAASMIARPLLALAAGAGGVFALRFLDGIGKGLKDPPKDTLIADSSEAKDRGKQFGIARMLDTFGSVVGPLVLFGLLWLLKDDSAKYRIILYATALPLLATLAILIVKVRETPSAKKPDKKLAVALPKRFYVFLAIVLLFNLGNSSDAFLILRAQNLGVGLLAIPLVFALFNFVYAVASVPLGSLSDRIGREKVILLGWFAYALAYLGFALADATWQVWALYAFYGLYYATTEGVAKALVADMVEAAHRGRAYGIYNTALGLISLPASFVAGYLWDKVAPATPFYFGAALALGASILLFVFLRFAPKTAAKD
jgi:MFS family permease